VTTDRRRRPLPQAAVVLLVTALVGVGVLARPAAAAVPLDQKLQVMSNWTQPTQASFDAWNAARADQGRWASYDFDWSTDYCSDSPDKPAGFDFTLPCWHHDWGYRNYKKVQRFDAATKSRIDSMFYADLQRVCSRYSQPKKAACDALAWTYYQAVKEFGSVTLSSADADHIARTAASGTATVGAP
jgi:hypothetical protein